VPTREIALQVADVLTKISADLPAPGLALGVFIGGMPTQEDQKLLRRQAQLPASAREQHRFLVPELLAAESTQSTGT
jgi:hypothetical protein